MRRAPRRCHDWGALGPCTSPQGLTVSEVTGLASPQLQKSQWPCSGAAISLEWGLGKLPATTQTSILDIPERMSALCPLAWNTVYWPRSFLHREIFIDPLIVKWLVKFSDIKPRWKHVYLAQNSQYDKRSWSCSLSFWIRHDWRQKPLAHQEQFSTKGQTACLQTWFWTDLPLISVGPQTRT